MHKNKKKEEALVRTPPFETCRLIFFTINHIDVLLVGHTHTIAGDNVPLSHDGSLCHISIVFHNKYLHIIRINFNLISHSSHNRDCKFREYIKRKGPVVMTEPLSFYFLLNLFSIFLLACLTFATTASLASGTIMTTPTMGSTIWPSHRRASRLASICLLVIRITPSITQSVNYAKKEKALSPEPFLNSMLSINEKSLKLISGFFHLLNPITSDFMVYNDKQTLKNHLI